MSRSQVRNDDLLRDVAQRVKRLREARGMSQEQVAMETGVHVGRIETGRLNVTVGTLAQLCRYFGVSLEDFFREIDDRPTEKSSV